MTQNNDTLPSAWGEGNLEFKVYGYAFEGDTLYWKEYFDDYIAAQDFARTFNVFEIIRRPENIRIAYSVTDRSHLNQSLQILPPISSGYLA